MSEDAALGRMFRKFFMVKAQKHSEKCIEQPADELKIAIAADVGGCIRVLCLSAGAFS